MTLLWYLGRTSAQTSIDSRFSIRVGDLMYFDGLEPLCSNLLQVQGNHDRTTLRNLHVSLNH